MNVLSFLVLLFALAVMVILAYSITLLAEKSYNIVRWKMVLVIMGLCIVMAAIGFLFGLLFEGGKITAEAAGPKKPIKTYVGITQTFLDIWEDTYDDYMNIGKVAEKEQDLDFWMMVTAPATDEDIQEEERLGEMELLAQIVEAEAGDQDLYGRRLVVDVILNRVDSPDFPDTIEGVIFQKGQFQPTWDGAFERAAYHISEKSFQAAKMEMNGSRIDDEILYFATWKANGRGFWKHGCHWFSY